MVKSSNPRGWLETFLAASEEVRSLVAAMSDEEKRDLDERTRLYLLSVKHDRSREIDRLAKAEEARRSVSVRIVRAPAQTLLVRVGRVGLWLTFEPRQIFFGLAFVEYDSPYPEKALDAWELYLGPFCLAVTIGRTG